MFGIAWPAPFDDPTVRTVSLGLATLGAVAGAIGTFAVVRRQSLQGDAVSHAALPGVALAFLFGAREPILLIVGAAIAGWVAMGLVAGITRQSRVPFDTALAGALAVFFGFGLVLMTYLKKLAGRPPTNAFERWVKPHAAESVGHGLDRYLFGQATFLRTEDVWTIALLGGGVVLVAVLFWKEFKLVSFDRDFAASIGYPTRWLDLLLTTLIVLAVVLGLKSAGVVLMSALLIAPAVAARQWTNRLGAMTAVSAGIGAAAGVGGAVLSHVLSLPAKLPVPAATITVASIDICWMQTPEYVVSIPAQPGTTARVLPLGPVVVLSATALVVLSLLVGSKRGLVLRVLLAPRAVIESARGASRTR